MKSIPAIPLVQREAPVSAAVAHAHAGVHPPARSLYIHTPFCVHKCHYCDFYSFVDSRGQQGAFVERLIEELGAIAPHAASAADATPMPLATIFVGGGTPSLLEVGLWRRVLEALRARFDLSLMGGGTGEFTVECNPESTTPELLDVLVAGGVNRVSIGAQSFEPRHLKMLERRHDPANVARAVNAARAAGVARVSVDLIFAIPGQTLEDWKRDLDVAIGLGLDHLSCYNLTYEPNTAMTQRLRAGDFQAVDDDLETEMFEHTVSTLRAAGLDRYEVSNFARGGISGPHASRHNLAYWRHEQWLAAGPSASGHLWAGATPEAGSWRWKNVPRLDDYLASGGAGAGHGPAAGAGFSPAIDVESPDARRSLSERLMMGVRVAEGLSEADMLHHAARLEGATADRLAACVKGFCASGLLMPDEASATAGRRWRLSDAGFLMTDHVAAELMAAVAGGGLAGARREG